MSLYYHRGDHPGRQTILSWFAWIELSQGAPAYPTLKTLDLELAWILGFHSECCILETSYFFLLTARGELPYETEKQPLEKISLLISSSLNQHLGPQSTAAQEESMQPHCSSLSLNVPYPSHNLLPPYYSEILYFHQRYLIHLSNIYQTPIMSQASY